MSDKVKSQHIGRKALLYVRQSSTYQVHHNLESQKLQYAMQERLRLLGWKEIEVIDEDLGCSAAGTVTRSGFERMVTGAIIGRGGRSGRPGSVSIRPQQPGVGSNGWKYAAWWTLCWSTKRPYMTHDKVMIDCC